MRILVTGKGGPVGSWAIRGAQLGGAIGATVFPGAEMSELVEADLVVVVKRISDSLLNKLRTARKRWVLDFVDGWPQQFGNEWTRDVAVTWLRSRLERLRPHAVVFPTSRMWIDSRWMGPAIVLPHHAWPKYQRRQVAAKVSRIGYEGDPRYLGRWREAVEIECRRRGWEFVVNGDLSACDIGVALRDTSGYPPAAWKANTKLANLQALGIPAICSPEFSYREFGSGAETFVESFEQLSAAFDRWTDCDARTQVAETMEQAAPRLDKVAETYRAWLSRVAST